MKRFLLPLIAVLIVVIMLIIALTGRKQPLTPQALAYLQKTYPLANKKKFNRRFFENLNFYWYAPGATDAFFDGVSKTVTPKSNPKFVCLAWIMPCVPKGPNNGVIRNQYRDGVSTPSLPGFQNNELVEVYHNQWYQEPGLYFYALKGTGTFLNIGKTLIARNKVDALHKLGMNDSDILKVLSYYFAKPDNGNTFDDIAQYAEDHKISFKKALTTMMDQAAEGKTYAADSFNRTASNDYALYMLAKEKGYDTVQFTNQANENGGWAFEIVDLRAKLSDNLNQRWTKERKFLFVADPFDPKHKAACNYSVPYKILRCTQRKIKMT